MEKKCEFFLIIWGYQLQHSWYYFFFSNLPNRMECGLTCYFFFSSLSNYIVLRLWPFRKYAVQFKLQFIYSQEICIFIFFKNDKKKKTSSWFMCVKWSVIFWIQCIAVYKYHPVHLFYATYTLSMDHPTDLSRWPAGMIENKKK